MSNDNSDQILNQLRAKAAEFGDEIAAILKREANSETADALEWIQERSQLIVSEIDEIIKRREDSQNAVINQDESGPHEGSD